MARRYVALLRAISNVSMAPFREKLERLGYSDVASFGMSGNLAFTAEAGVAELERPIGEAVGTTAIVRTVAELKRAVTGNPLPAGGGSAILFLARVPSVTKRKALSALDLNLAPVLRGRTLYFDHPVTLKGRRAPLDLEKLLGVVATARSARIVARIAEEAGRPSR